jgi:hypothetical protein
LLKCRYAFEHDAHILRCSCSLSWLRERTAAAAAAAGTRVTTAEEGADWTGGCLLGADLQLLGSVARTGLVLP